MCGRMSTSIRLTTSERLKTRGARPMARDHLLAIDQGTTSTRAVVYDHRLRPVGQSQAEVLPTYPQSGWVEHDPAALVDSVAPQVRQALAQAGLEADRIAAIGLTNQR